VKKFFIKTLYTGLAFSLLFLAGCMNPLTSPKETPVSGNNGLVVVNFDGTEAARTAVPDAGLSAFTKYDLTFSGGPVPGETITVTGGPVSQSLTIGTWAITVTAYTGSPDNYTAVAEGKAEGVNVTEGGITLIAITLGPRSGGANGTVSYAVTVMTPMDSGSLSITRPDGTGVAGGTVTLNGETVSEGSLTLPAGEYVARVRLVKGGQYAGFTEVLHIYPGMASALPERIYDAEDFVEPVNAGFDLTGLIAAPVVNGVPQTTLDTARYTAAITWQRWTPTPRIAVSGAFSAGTTYRATVNFVPKPGYTFIGVGADSFTHSGAGTFTYAADSTTLTLPFAALADAADDATLRNLALQTPAGALTLSPAFEPGVTAYTARFAKDLSDSGNNEIQINTATVNNSSATVVNPASAYTPASDGDNVFNLTVTAADSVTTKTYTITVTMLTLSAAQMDADLASLGVSTGNLDPVFDPAVTAYSLTVFAPSITITGVAKEASNGAVVSANSGTPQNLNIGPNTIRIVVTTAQGMITKSYTVTVTRKAPDADLSSLAVDRGILSPPFNPGLTSYSVGVPYSVPSITVTGLPRAIADGAAVSANSGTAQNLSVGANTIPVMVTAADGVTTKTYTVTVNRAAQNSDASLQSLTLGTGILSPAFDPGLSAYAVTVPGSVSSITVTGIASETGAGVSANSGVPQSLSAGENTIALVVTAPNGVTTKTYTVTVNRLGSGYIEIYSDIDLAKIGNDGGYPLSGKYLLMTDIALNDWTPAAPDAANAFSGSFDGNGHTITLNSFASAAVSANAYLGVFGYVKGSDPDKAIVKDLTIVSSINNNTSTIGQAIGLVAGYTEKAEVSGINIRGNLTYSTTQTIYAGGVVGIAMSGTVIRDCIGSANLNANGGTGGGLVPGLAVFNYVGGFVGIFKDGVDIVNCHNTGDVISFCTVTSSQVYAGGITGGSTYGMSTAYHGKVEDCSFAGILHAKAMGYWTYAGGIAGTIVGDGDGTLEHTTRIVGCLVTGTVSIADTASGFPYVGGVVAYNYYGALVSQSCFTGQVIATKGQYTGGIAGYNSQTTGHNSRVEDCWSGGTVTGVTKAGGIVGENQVNTYIRRCYSIAAITANSAGGIAGSNASVQPDAVTACVALNPSITSSGTGTGLHRVTGTKTAFQSNNYGWSGTILANSNGQLAPTDAVAAGMDGADTIAKPPRLFYENLGWDFNTVWKMGGNGYPVLMWQ
jgi:hypothetical protein